MPQKMLLGYWDIRGLGAAVRYLLEHAGVDYEEKHYSVGPPPELDKSSWLNEKFTLGLDFPNLPYLVDGDLKLTQSHVILRYLARKYKLDGANETERVRAELAAAHVYDIHLNYALSIAYNPDFMKAKDEYNASMPDKFKQLTNFLGSNNYVAGNSITWADFVLFEYLENQLFFNSDLLKDSPVLEQYHKRMLASEGVKKYFAKPGAIKFPFTLGTAYIGGPYSDLLQKELAQSGIVNRGIRI